MVVERRERAERRSPRDLGPFVSEEPAQSEVDDEGILVEAMHGVVRSQCLSGASSL